MIKILVPVDFSATSSNALTYAIRLFGVSELEITLLHVYETRSTTMMIKNIDKMIEDDCRLEMNELIEKFIKKHPKVTFKFKILKDYAVQAIRAYGDSGDYDFIVMGTQGASGLKEVFLGSVAGGVISKTTAPVIVVPEGYAFAPLNEIVVALGDAPFSKKEVADPLRKIASLHKSKIKVLHISDEKPDSIESALKEINDLNPSVEYTFGSGDIHEDLNEYLIKNDSGLLCLMRSKKGFFERLFKESVTLKQTFDSPAPLLILHDEG
jgi:nucleotide-binding universal stress UspA family protein